VALADRIGANPHWLPINPSSSLAHIPGEDGIPFLGTTLKMLKDPVAFTRSMVAKHGRVYRTKSFGGQNVSLIGPDANELVLFDRDKLFSSEQGWGPVLNQLFPRGLMLMDFEKHRVHRRTLSVAFKPAPMRNYADALNAGIAARVKEWSGTKISFYASIKDLTLDLAATSFLGIPWGPEAQKVNQAFVDMVGAAIGVVRMPLPGTKMGRGVAGRKFLLEYFGKEVPKRRAGQGEDIFTQICKATHEDGSLLTDDEIVDHMNFLMMAAHDTITSSVTSMVMLLGKHPEWQEKLRAEMDGLGVNGDDLPYDRLDELVLTDCAFKEAMRLIPPVPSIPRRAIKAFDFGGYHIPAGTFVSVSPSHVHKMEEYWPDPDRFDPLRHTAEEVRGRHKYAFVPFGGGAHMCLGLHFANMQARIFFWHLLRTHRIEIAHEWNGKWQAWPIPKPDDGLPVRIVPLDG
jgi:cytochrome P450